MVLDLFLLPFYMINILVNTVLLSFLISTGTGKFSVKLTLLPHSGEKIETLLTVVPQPLNNGNKVSPHLVYLG